MYEELKPAVARLERLSQLLEGLIEYVSCHVCKSPVQLHASLLVSSPPVAVVLLSAPGVLIGDRTYHSPKTSRDWQTWVWSFWLPTPPRKETPLPKERLAQSRLRYRIDTVFPQLTERYCVKKVWARSVAPC